MTSLRPRPTRPDGRIPRSGDDSGSVAVYVLGVIVVLMAVVGLVADGGTVEALTPVTFASGIQLESGPGLSIVPHAGAAVTIASGVRPVPSLSAA